MSMLQSGSCPSPQLSAARHVHGLIMSMFDLVNMLIEFTLVFGTNKQVRIHTHTHTLHVCNAVEASVGLAQASCNNLLQFDLSLED